MYGSTIVVISDALFSVLKQTDRHPHQTNVCVYNNKHENISPTFNKELDTAWQWLVISPETWDGEMEWRHIIGEGPQRGAGGDKKESLGRGRAVGSDSHRKETRLKI